ncbi:uncharacterized protein V6R79_017471 [Siganus canaliculatus]
MLLSVVVLTAAAAAAAVSEAQYDDFTPAPDYDGDYNATFDYSFYSNTSSDDLDLFSNRFFEGDEDEEDTGGPETTPTQRPVEGVTVATTRPTTEQSRVGVRSAASLPVSSLMIKYELFSHFFVLSPTNCKNNEVHLNLLSEYVEPKIGIS